MASVVAEDSATNPQSPFEKTMASLNLPKQDLNVLVMDFLIKEGYPAAAQKFADEANLSVKEDDTFINERVQIRDAIFRGDVQTAIEEVNEINPNILDRNHALHFSLLRLQLIEKIKFIFNSSEADKPTLINEAIGFAQQKLAPYTSKENDTRFRTDLERAMTLLIVPREAWQNPQPRSNPQNQFGALAELVDPTLRVRIANEVNSAILRQQNQPEQTKIQRLLSTRAWSEELAREKKIQLPDNLDLGLGKTGPQTGSRNGHGDGGDTQMTDDGEEHAGNDPVTRYTNIS